MEEHIQTLIAAQLSGEATPEELEQLANWRSQSTHNELHYEQLAQLWEQSARVKHLAAVDLDKDWAQVRNHMQEQSFTSRLGLRWAAAIAILVFGALVLGYLLSPQPGLQYSAMDAPQSIQLADGSTVHLNKGAELVLEADFGKHDRKMQLTGEAFFEVASDVNRPFIIHTQSATTQVVGTAFNLKEALGQTSILVTEGKVSFSGNGEQLTLTAGMAAAANDNSLLLIASDVNRIAWHTRKLSFRQASLLQALQQIADFYELEIQTDGIDETMRISSDFNDQSIDEVLNEIALIHGLEWTKTGASTYQINSKRSGI